MATQTTKVKNGTIVLPRELRKAWKEAEILIRPDRERLIIEKLEPKPKDKLKAWEKARGILKGRKIPDPIKWQEKIRREWERKLP